MITSTANPQVKNLIQLVKKAKVRNEQRLFVVEGIRMFREIPEGWLDRIYVSEHFMEEESHVKVLQGKNYEVLANHVFESVSDTKTPQGNPLSCENAGLYLRRSNTKGKCPSSDS